MSNKDAEQWAEICFLLQGNVPQNISERDYENQVVRAIEVLGWREFKREIDRQPMIQLGREGTLRPDLIIRGDNRKCLIVVEIKRPTENITRDYVIGQLRSYMRQMKADFGFLIGTELRVYYDGSLNPHTDPILLERIDFDQFSKVGAEFVGSFNKDSLLGNGHTEYLKSRLRQFNKSRNLELLINQLTSAETMQKVIGYLRGEFADTDDETFSEALERIVFEISRKDQAANTITENDRRFPQRRIRGSQTKAPEAIQSVPETTEDRSNIARLAFDSHLQTRLKHIYGVLYFMKQGLDFPAATHQTLKLFPEVQDYQTISDKCGRGFAGNVDTFLSWYESREMLSQLVRKFSLSDHDANIFRTLLS